MLAFLPVPTPCFDGIVQIAEQTYDYVDNEYYFGGRVEVCYDEVYHPVCDLGWDDLEAAVVCISYGYTRPFYRTLISSLSYDLFQS